MGSLGLVCASGDVTATTSPIDIWNGVRRGAEMTCALLTDVLASLQLGVLLARKDTEGVRTEVVALGDRQSQPGRDASI